MSSKRESFVFRPPPGFYSVLLGAVLTGLGLFTPELSRAEVSDRMNEHFAGVPGFLVNAESSESSAGNPYYIFAMSRDHQLFYKAYSDYSDFNNDNVPEVGYQHPFEYYGYFDPFKCYNYDNTDERFEPAAFSPYVSNSYTKYCDGVSGDWSGNFLNWASTSRMDIIRKALYGGKRHVDTATETVLESAFIPQDAHAFAKYYNGDDINRLTPHPRPITLCRVSLVVMGSVDSYGVSQESTAPPLLRVVEGDFRLWAASQGVQCGIETGSEQADIENGEQQGRGGNITSGQGSVDSIIRTYFGYTVFDSSGVRSEEDPQLARTAIRPANSESYHARVLVCNETLNSGGQERDREGCRNYSSGGDSTYKPTGVIQRFHGEGARFALLTGTYVNNLKGGVLRRAFSDNLHEYNALGIQAPHTNTDVVTYGSITQNLDALRIYGYGWEDSIPHPNPLEGGYVYSRTTRPASDYITFCNSLGAILRNGYPERESKPERRGDCPSWGNPFGEIYAEAVNYVVGGTVTSDFTGERDEDINRPGTLERLQQIAWGNNSNILGDPMRDLECSPVNIVAINTSLVDHDADNMPSIDAAGGSSITMAQIETKTNQIGTQEVGSGSSRLVGSATADGTDADYSCTAKEITNLADVRGICPGWVSGEGSYLSSGLAAHVYVEDLRVDRGGSQTITTYALNLSPDLPIIRVPGGAAGEPLVAEIIPAYWNIRHQAAEAREAGDGNRLPWFLPGVGQLVDFQVLEAHNNNMRDCDSPKNANPSHICYLISGGGFTDSDELWIGRYLAIWEDSVAGSDYDEDLAGLIEYVYSESGRKLLVATHLLHTSVTSRSDHFFGFILAGTKDGELDGLHAYSGWSGEFLRDPIYGEGDPDPVSNRRFPAYANIVNRDTGGDDFWGVANMVWDPQLRYGAADSVSVSATNEFLTFSAKLDGADYEQVGFPSPSSYKVRYGQFQYGQSGADTTNNNANSTGTRERFDCGDTSQRNIFGRNSSARQRREKPQDYPHLTRYMLDYARNCGDDPGAAECAYANFIYEDQAIPREDPLTGTAVTEEHYESIKVPSCGWPLPQASTYLLKSTGETEWKRPTPPLYCYSQHIVGLGAVNMRNFLEADGSVRTPGAYTGSSDVCTFGRTSSANLRFRSPSDRSPISRNVLTTVSTARATRRVGPPAGRDGSFLHDPASTRAWHVFDMASSYESPYLESPLYYAAKWGGFRDSNGNNIPDQRAEWDSFINSTGAVGADGLPDTYYEVTDPARLEEALARIILQGGLGQRTGSGTAAAVLANEREGLGGVYQAYFEVERKDERNNLTVSWIGTLYALFIDPEGRLREDSNKNGRLDDYQTDFVVQVFYDAQEGDTRLRRFRSSRSDRFENPSQTDHPLESLQPLWNARERLSDLTDTQVANQRTYSNIANTGRHIVTWIDKNRDRVVNRASEIINFDTSATGPSSYYAFMDVESARCAQDVISYARGRDETGAIRYSDSMGVYNCAHLSAAGGVRGRALDYDKNPVSGNAGNGREVMRLGDIAHSAPVAVVAPAEAYDLLSGDGSYGVFRRTHIGRRQMIYVGANDGLLHAFNAGFYNLSTRTFGAAPSSGSAVSHPLGSEIWGYVPGNLIPRLKYYMQANYEHMFFVDGVPRVFDARIFPVDANHPHGWGTVMVVGFRLGGNPDNPADPLTYESLNKYRVDTEDDGLCGNNTDNDHSDDIPFKSALVVLDITNPEAPPRIIAELSPINNASAILGANGCDATPTGGLQFATSGIGVVPISAPWSGTGTRPSEKWYLMVGSGSSDISSLEPLAGTTPEVTPHLYIYDLEALVGGGDPNSSSVLTVQPLTAAANEFVGGFVASDYDLDLSAEVSYFGTIGVSAGDRGRLYRIHIGERSSASDWEYNILLNANQPISSSPSITLDSVNTSWVLFGSGRFLANVDNNSEVTQTLYGIRDANPWDVPDQGSSYTVSKSGGGSACGLLDVSNAVVTSGGVDVDGNSTVDYNTVSQMLGEGLAKNDLSTYASSSGLSGGYYCGWYRDYPSNPGDPSYRSTTRTVLLSNALFSTSYAPPGAPDLQGITPPRETQASCVAELGNSYLFAVDWRVGVPPDSGLLGRRPCAEVGISCPVGVTEVNVPVASLGKGIPSAPSLHVGQPGEHVPGKVTVILQQSTGETRTEQTESEVLLNTEVSWREYIEE